MTASLALVAGPPILQKVVPLRNRQYIQNIFFLHRKKLTTTCGVTAVEQFTILCWGTGVLHVDTFPKTSLSNWVEQEHVLHLDCAWLHADLKQYLSCDCFSPLEHKCRPGQRLKRFSINMMTFSMVAMFPILVYPIGMLNSPVGPYFCRYFVTNSVTNQNYTQMGSKIGHRKLVNIQTN